MRRILGIAAVVAHLALFATVALALAQRYAERRSDVDALREQAEREHHATVTAQHELEVARARLEGLRRDDPYVVELLARDQLGMQGGAEEIRPPPLVDGAQ